MTRMPSRIAVIAIDAVNPRLVAEFWCNVLGWHVVDEVDEGVISIALLNGAWPTIDVLGVAERKAVKNRLHVDLRADGVATPDELERLLSLGARRVEPGWLFQSARTQASSYGLRGLVLRRPVIVRSEPQRRIDVFNSAGQLGHAFRRISGRGGVGLRRSARSPA